MDTLQARIVQLEQENAALRALLKKHGIAYPETAENQISAIANQGSRMLQNEVTPQMVSFFYTYFRGRKDVYSVRSRPKDGKAGYFPVCTHFWDHKLCPKTTGQKIACRDCPNRVYKPLSIRALLAHLKGEREDSSDVVGIYPLLPDDTCYFLVFDFDDHEGTFQGSEKTVSWRDEVDALRKICELEQIDALVERSRSGQGAHVWIFFSEPVSAQKARQFGTALLTKGAEVVSLKSFRAYDRMLPLQEHLPEGKLGNLIALPLQGRALRNGNSAFVDENWNAYPDQWGALKSARKLSVKEIEDKIAAWTPEAGLLGQLAEEPQEAEENTQKSFLPEKPWRKTELTLHPEDVEGAVDLVYANGVYIKSTNLKPRLQNQLRRLAAYKNPEFHKKLAMGFSTLGIPRIVYCGHDDGDFICLPRGCVERLKELLEEAAIPYHITDERQSDRKIKVSFAGQLYPEQQRAADALLAHDIGVLSAATAFGKTAVAAYLIAARRVNTLVLVDSAEILKNWQEDLQKFLTIEEKPPTYTTPAGRVKRRISVIGKLQGGQNTLTGILDVAMIPSLGKSERLEELVQGYGMVLMDECHHAGADTDTAVLRSVTAKYVYGLTATPKRDDGQDRKIFLQLGPIRFRYTATDRAKKQGIGHYVYPRFTRFVHLSEKPPAMAELNQLVIESEDRNAQILSDTITCVQNGRTPLVMTKYKEHARLLYQRLQGSADHVFLLQGGKSSKERAQVRDALLAVSETDTLIVVAIGKYIGEGFNLPRLDTLLLAMPISWQGNVEQYAGRLNRDYDGKQDVIIFDYIDAHVPTLERMYHKRLRAYRQIGFEICANLQAAQEEKTGTIFDAQTYTPVYERDLQAAQREILISSPALSRKKVTYFLELLRERQEAGVQIKILTLAPDAQDTYQAAEKIGFLRQSGIEVFPSQTCREHFAILDRCLVWYGSMNLLSNEKPDDNLIRLPDEQIAQELLEIAVQADSASENKTG